MRLVEHDDHALPLHQPQQLPHGLAVDSGERLVGRHPPASLEHADLVQLLDLFADRATQVSGRVRERQEHLRAQRAVRNDHDDEIAEPVVEQHVAEHRRHERLPRARRDVRRDDLARVLTARDAPRKRDCGDLVTAQVSVLRIERHPPRALLAVDCCPRWRTGRGDQAARGRFGAAMSDARIGFTSTSPRVNASVVAFSIATATSHPIGSSRSSRVIASAWTSLHDCPTFARRKRKSGV